MKLLSILTASAVLALAPTTAFASLVTNGGFDDYQGNLAGGYYQHIANGTLPGDAGNLVSGWGVGFGPLANSSDSGIDLVRDNGPVAPAANGNQFVDLNGTPGPGNIYQSLTTVPGQTYKLKFAYTSTINTWGLYGVWDGDENGTPLIPLSGVNALPSGNPLVWLWQEATFVADSAQTLIGFGQFDPLGGNVGIYLDAVSVSAVPEPATIFVWSLLGLATAAVSYKRARKNAAVNA